jgi:hypothetical protein
VAPGACLAAKELGTVTEPERYVQLLLNILQIVKNHSKNT